MSATNPGLEAEAEMLNAKRAERITELKSIKAGVDAELRSLAPEEIETAVILPPPRGNDESITALLAPVVKKIRYEFSTARYNWRPTEKQYLDDKMTDPVIRELITRVENALSDLADACQ